MITARINNTIEESKDMQVIFSQKISIDEKSLAEIVKAMCAEYVDDAYIFQH